VKRATLVTEAITHMAIHRVHRMAILEDDDGDCLLPFCGSVISNGPLLRLSPFLSPAVGPTVLPIPFRRVHSIITQSDLFSMMVSYTYSLPSGTTFDSKIHDLRLDFPKVSTCSLKDKTSDAYAKMQESGFSSLGVVDSNGKLVNYLGVSHLKSITSANLSDLHLPVDLFLKHRQPHFVACHLDVTLKEVISTVKSSHYHRVFFIDNNDLPLGVMTLRDFLEVVVMRLKLFG